MANSKSKAKNSQIKASEPKAAADNNTNDSQDISIGDVFSKAWKLLTENLSVWAGIAVLYILPSVLLALILGSAFDINPDSLTTWSPGDFTAAVGGAVVTAVVIGIYQLLLTAVLLTVYIKTAEGAKLTGIKQTLDLGIPRLGRVLLAMLVVGLIVVVGFMLLFIPGVIALFLLALTVYIMADTDMPLGDSMSLSAKYASTYFVPILLFFLALIGISFGVSIITGIFRETPDFIAVTIDTTLQAGLQLFSGLAAAVLYVEIKKRFKA